MGHSNRNVQHIVRNMSLIFGEQKRVKYINLNHQILNISIINNNR